MVQKRNSSAKTRNSDTKHTVPFFVPLFLMNNGTEAQKRNSSAETWKNAKGKSNAKKKLADSISVTIGPPFIFLTKEERTLKKCLYVSLSLLS